MNSDDCIGCALAAFVVSGAVLFLVMAAGLAGCIDSKAFKGTRTIVVVGEAQE